MRLDWPPWFVIHPLLAAGSGEGLFYHLNQVLGAERLGQDTVSTLSHGVVHCLLVRVSSGHYNLDLAIELFQAPKRFQAVHIW